MKAAPDQVFYFSGTRRSTGEKLESTIRAKDEEAAYNQLIERGIDVIGVKSLSTSEASSMSTEEGDSSMLVLLSFLIPVAGFIVGAIYLGKESDRHQRIGRNCLRASGVSIGLGLFVLFFIFLAASSNTP